MPANPGECGEACAKVLRDAIREQYGFGVEAHVSKMPPLIATPYKPVAMRCPHGTVWYAEPTSEQIAAWSEAGVE